MDDGHAFGGEVIPPSSADARRKVVFVTPSFAGGGAERVMVTFANTLDPQKFQVAIIALSDRGPLKELVEGHVRKFVLNRARMRTSVLPLIELLRRLQPDYVVSSATHVNLPLLAARWLLPRRTSIVVREPNLPSKALDLSPYPRIFAWGLRHLYPRADAVIASSTTMHEELCCYGIPRERISLITNPVDVARIRRFAQRSIRRPGHGRRFLAVGRLVPQKGFGRLISIMQDMPEEDHLTILGEGPERKRLEAMLETSGVVERVDLVGFVKNPWAWMAGADAMVVPSVTEGLPNAVLDALVCGTPVSVTPESGGISDIAEAAAPGYIRVTPIERFQEEMKAIDIRGSEMSEVNLPAQNAKEAVTVELEKLLLAMAPRAPRAGK